MGDEEVSVELRSLNHKFCEVKARLPIWKRQVFTDGEEEWVACP